MAENVNTKQKILVANNKMTILTEVPVEPKPIASSETESKATEPTKKITLKARTLEKPFQPNAGAELMYVSEAIAFFNDEKKVASSAQEQMGRPRRFGLFDGSAEGEKQRWAALNDAATLENPLEPWANQKVFWVDLADKDEILRFNQTDSDMTGSYLGAMQKQQDFLCKWDGPLFWPAMSLALKHTKQHTKQHEFEVTFDSAPDLRLSDLLPVDDYKDLQSGQKRTGFHLDTLALTVDKRLPHEADQLGVHVMLKKITLTDFLLEGIHTPVEVNVSSTVVAVPSEGNGLFESVHARLADREIRGTCEYARPISSHSGRGITHRVVIRKGQNASTMPEADRVIAAIDHKLFSDPWVSRFMYVNFVQLRRAIERASLPEWFDELILLNTDIDDAHHHSFADPIWILVSSHNFYLQQEFEAWRKLKHKFLSDQSMLTKADDLQKLPAVVAALPLKGTQKLSLHVHKQTLLDMVDTLEKKCHQVDTLLNLNYFKLGVQLPRELKVMAEKRMFTTGYDTTAVEADPFVRYSITVSVEHLHLAKDIARKLTTPVLTRSSPDFPRSNLHVLQHNLKTASVHTDFFSDSILVRGIANTQSEVAAVEQAVVDKVAAVAAASGVALEPVKDEKYWQFELQKEWDEFEKNKTSSTVRFQQMEDRKGAATSETEKRVRSAWNRQKSEKQLQALARGQKPSDSAPRFSDKYSFAAPRESEKYSFNAKKD